MSNERLKHVFGEVVEVPPGNRAAHIDAACGDDDDLRREVALLLEAHDRAGGFMGSPCPAAVAVGDDGSSLVELPNNGSWLEQPGTRIGRYELVRAIGEGGFGTVYLAEQRTPVVRTVALKVIKPGMDTRQVLARFDAERQALALMDHPNIAKALDAGATEAGRPYFVMEHVDGERITHWCNRTRSTIAQRLDLILQVCQAVQHAHHKGVIHRDLKPSNVLVALVDGQAIAKVIDFGVAKATTAPLTGKTLMTEARTLIGTPEYMSPEQAGLDGADIDTRSDVYSLGVLLYEVLTGATPFGRLLRDAPIDEVRRIIREVDPPPPSTWLTSQGASTRDVAVARSSDPARLGSMLRGDLDCIVMKCLEKDRERRYGAASELAQDIRRHLTNEPVLAGPPSTVYRLRKFVRRNRASVAAGIAIAAVAGSMLFAGITAMREQRTSAERQTAQERADNEQRSRRAVTLIMQMAFSSMGLGASPPGRKLLDDVAWNVEHGALAHDPLNEVDLLAFLASSYHTHGLWCQAIPLQQRVVEARRRLHGDDSDHVATAIHTLAQYHGYAWQYADAEMTARDALRRWRVIRGDDSREACAATKDLATARLNQGFVDEAIEMFRGTLEDVEELHGQDSAPTGLALSALGRALCDRGDFDEAEPLLRRSSEIFQQTHPASEPFPLCNLARLLAATGRIDEAEAHLRQALRIREKALGPEQVWVGHTLAALAEVLERRGDAIEAEELLRRAIAILDASRGREHPETACARGALAGVLVARGSLDQAVEAEELAGEAIEILDDAAPMDHRAAWCRFDAMSIRGAAVAIQAQTPSLAESSRLALLQEAESLLVNAWEHLAPPPASEHRRDMALQRVVDLYELWPQPDKFREWTERLEAAQTQ